MPTASVDGADDVAVPDADDAVCYGGGCCLGCANSGRDPVPTCVLKMCVSTQCVLSA